MNCEHHKHGDRMLQIGDIFWLSDAAQIDDTPMNLGHLSLANTKRLRKVENKFLPPFVKPESFCLCSTKEIYQLLSFRFLLVALFLRP